MKNYFSILFSMLIAGNSACYAATLNSLNKEQFIKAFVNKTSVSIPTDNLNGRTIENTFSMFLDDSGHVIGKMSQKPINEPQKDTGSYSIDEDGTAYITWKHWDGGKKLCFHAVDTTNAYVNVDCDHVFHTAFMKDAIKSGNHLEK